MTERVHTIHNFYDRPRSSVANFNGEPHWFERIFSEASDDYADTYALVPLPAEVVSADLEANAIFKAWNNEFAAGRVSQDTHPALRGRNVRFAALQKVVSDYVASHSPTATMRGKFTRIEFHDAQVLWSSIDLAQD
jgi:hypothetical protein